MISVLNSLEIRRFDTGEIISKELEAASEMYFVQSGRYNIGYEVNKIVKYRL